MNGFLVAANCTNSSASPALQASERAYIQNHVRIKQATSEIEKAAIRRLRHAVFCVEQGLFNGDDTDEVDAWAVPLAAVLSASDGVDEVVGTVRIHQAQPGLWYGSRLAVAHHARRIGAVGSGLIRLAVGSAHAQGCHSFFAHVQSQNVALFQRLHWHCLATVTVHGLGHQLMQADLAHYPPIEDGASGFLLRGARL